jgi:hypothetical protein
LPEPTVFYDDPNYIDYAKFNYNYNAVNWSLLFYNHYS